MNNNVLQQRLYPTKTIIMNPLINKIKTLAYSILFILVVIGCNSNKNKESIERTQNVLSSVIDSIDSEIKSGKYGMIDRFMIIRNDKILADFKYKQDYESIAKKYDTTDHQYNYDHPNWHPYYAQTDLHSLQSVTKSVNSILLGIALDLHSDYNLKTKVMSLFSDYPIENEDERKNEITIEDLLTMRAGLHWNEVDYLDSSDDCVAMEASNDWINYVLNKPIDTLPGTSFVYNSGASVLLGEIVRIITGKKVDEWAEEKLFKPLGITDYYWKKTPTGALDTEGGLYLKAEDLAKIGSLFLNGGKWQGKQVVPQKWVSSSISPIASNLYPGENDNTGYGYQWWVWDHINGKTKIFGAQGYGGQYLTVAPDYNLIVLFNGWNIHKEPRKYSWAVMQDRIIPILEKNR